MRQSIEFNETDIKKAIIYYTKNLIVMGNKSKYEWKRTVATISTKGNNISANVKLEIVGDGL